MKHIIAALLRANRPDLVDALVQAKIGYWEQQYRRLDQQADELQRRIKFFAGEVQKLQGASIPTKRLRAAAARLDDVRADLRVLRDFRTPSVPRAA